MPVPWSIRLARAVFLTLAVALGAAIAAGFKQPVWHGTAWGFFIGGVFVAVDSMLAQFTFREFSFSTFGLLTGLFCAWLILKIGFFELPWFRALEDADSIRSIIEISTYACLGFLGITLALRSDKDQFCFIIPYVRFRRDASEGEPILLDANVLIDGRVLRVFATGFISGSLVIPRFVLDEIQRMADSREPINSERGRRGLACVEKMRTSPGFDVTIHEDQLHENEPSDTRLITLARELSARLLTHDVNLGKVAAVRGVAVLNFNDLARALQPELCAGDELDLSLIKPGKDKHQAVGYLPDGTMIVVNNAISFIGESVPVVVVNTTQTSAGRLIFAELQMGQPSPPITRR